MQRIFWRMLLLAGVLASGACDDRRTFRLPAEPTPAATTPPTTARPDLAGTYKLTIEADAACVDLPEVARKRTYQATLETTPYNYLGISIIGGGFTQPTVTGDLWNGTSIDWNNFDIGGCDGSKEPLDQSRSLMICGAGAAQAGPSSITAAVTGKIWVDEESNGSTRRISECSGTHRFVFQRQA